jgi:hypothetical protein
MPSGRDLLGKRLPEEWYKVTDLGAGREDATLEVEELLEADREARPRRYRLHRQQDTGHERGAVEGVVADRECLARGTEQDLLVRDPALETKTVHAHAADFGPARTDGGFPLARRGLASRRASVLVPRVLDELRGP